MEPTAGNRLIINSTMGSGHMDYEAVYTLSSTIHLSELHNHHFYEIHIHINGGKIAYVNEQVYNQKPGSLLIFPPFQLHGIINCGTLYNYERAFLYITPELLQTLGCGLMSFEHILTEKVKSAGYQYLLSEQDRNRCVQLLRAIAGQTGPQTPARRLEDYANLIQFLLIICKNLQEQKSSIQYLESNSLIRDVFQYIERNYASPLTLESLAGHFNISKSYLSHEFMKTIHSSVYQYILFRRITYAKQLLAQGGKPMDVAYQCGFSEYSGFLRSFQKMAGCSPREFKKRLT